jgi:IclR family acetate operon transcriptional repressor
MTSLDIEDDKVTQEGDSSPRSPVRTVQVLHELAVSAKGVPLAVLAARLQLPKTSLFRLLRALENSGYVSSINGVHQLGPSALKLGMAIVQNRDLPNWARPVMEWLAAQSSETVILGVIDESETQVVYTDMIEPSNPLRFIIKAGITKPLYCSAIGLTILTYMPSATKQRYLNTVEFVQYAPKTISTVTKLKRKLEEIRASGIAVSVDGMFDGVYSVAAPVVNAAGAVRAGVSISAPSTRGLKQEEPFASLVSKAGLEISRVLGYTGVYPPI